jgi:hypothetical protein
MSVPDDAGLDQYAPGVVEAMGVLAQNLHAVQGTIEDQGVTRESMRIAAALLRSGASDLDRLAEGLPA